MAAYADTDTTQDFADLLYRISEEDEAADLTIDDAAERGWMVPEGEQLLVVDNETGTEYLIAIRKVSR